MSRRSSGWRLRSRRGAAGFCCSKFPIRANSKPPALRVRRGASSTTPFRSRGAGSRSGSRAKSCAGRTARTSTNGPPCWSRARSTRRSLRRIGKRGRKTREAETVRAIWRLPALDQTAGRKVLLARVEISASVPAKGGRVSAPVASQSAPLGDVGRLFWRLTQSRYWRLTVDLYPVLTAAALPWSTTAVVVLLSIWFIVLIPTIEPEEFWRSLAAPSSLAPTVFFTLAVIGMLWTDGPWSARVLALGPVAKLLMLPFLLYHFGRSTRAHWVFWAFLISCSLLLVYSWIIFVAPAWQFRAAHGFDTAGVPVRNAIDQSQEFVLCAFGLASVAVAALRKQQSAVAMASGVLAAAFLCNVFFVALART